MIHPIRVGAVVVTTKDLELVSDGSQFVLPKGSKGEVVGGHNIDPITLAGGWPHDFSYRDGFPMYFVEMWGYPGVTFCIPAASEALTEWV